MTADFDEVSAEDIDIDEDIDVADVEEDEVFEADPADVAEQRREVPLEEGSEEDR
jgi:hypothetical protein